MFIDPNIEFQNFQFDIIKYPFDEVLLKSANDLARQKGRKTVSSLEHLHTVFSEREVEEIRQGFFKLFRTTAFQNVFHGLTREIILANFDEKTLVQKTPTVRVQFPGAESTSFHCDGWYGHSTSAMSFWLPLIDVQEGNTLYMASSGQRSESLMREIIENRFDLDEINQKAAEICEPIEGEKGTIWCFKPHMIHGAKENISEKTRVSFDFRIATDAEDLASKPRTNYYSLGELSSLQPDDIVVEESTQDIVAMSYSNGCNGVASKSQLLLCTAYAEANSVSIFRNEAEINALPHLPALRTHLSSRNDQFDAIVTFGLDIFNSNVALCSEILACADLGNKKLIFCAESIIYDPSEGNKELVINLVKPRQNP